MDTSSRSLPFLDVKVSITPDNNIKTSVYRKPTNTNVLLNYGAVAPKRWKQSIINCFLTRAKRVSSSKELFEKEVDYIKKVLANNGYPKRFVEKAVEDFRTRNERSDRPTDEAKERKLTQSFFLLPYVGKASEKFFKRLRSEMLQHRVEMRCAYQTTKVGSYFSLKQPVPRLFRSCVVYNYQCPLDKDVRYIGETERHIFTRIVEHCATNSAHKSRPSAIRDHLGQCGVCASSRSIEENFSIIRSCTRSDVLIQEALCIKSLSPSLNVQLGPYKGSRVQANIFG